MRIPSRIVICCDGTWNSADQGAVNGELCVTNVLKIACRLKKETDAGELQIVYYDQGVGTGNALDRIVGGAFGDGLEANIHDAYRFLIANYEPGDKIYIFGFSRGAYTARSIAGMIRRCGILRRDKVREYPNAKKIYETTRKAEDAAAVEFRKLAAIEPETAIQCVGVWDTVGALGIPLRAFGRQNKKKYEFLDTRLSKAVKYAFHALAIDEHRGMFAPTLWDSDPVPGQTVQQVWFAGAHSDVGGGYPEHSLSDIALEWMMEAATTAELEFDPGVIAALKPPNGPDPLQKAHDSRKGFYNVQPSLDRPVGAFRTEYFHQRLVERWQKDPSYRPKSLERHEARLKSISIAAGGPIYPVAG
jgi:uncharacterized protein (DUF2235 family)